MATNPVDPIEEEAGLIFADPETRARTERFNARLARSESVKGRFHNKAREIGRLQPLPEYDLDE